MRLGCSCLAVSSDMSEHSHVANGRTCICVIKLFHAEGLHSDASSLNEVHDLPFLTLLVQDIARKKSHVLDQARDLAHESFAACLEDLAFLDTVCGEDTSTTNRKAESH